MGRERLRRRIAIAVLAVACTGRADAAPRVLAFDQCADQYVLALSPRDAIVGLSARADDKDSRLRALAHGLPLRRIDLETALAARPQVVVRNWGGDARMVRALQSRGVRVIEVAEAASFDDVRGNIRRVAAALGRPQAGEALIGEMDGRLARAAGAWKGARVLYITPGGLTAGPGTLVDAALRAAGLTNAETRSGYRTLSLEDLALRPPQAVVLGFFDTFQLAGDSWGPGRHVVLRDIVRTRAIASLPGSQLGCPDWGAAEAAEQLAARARR